MLKSGPKWVTNGSKNVSFSSKIHKIGVLARCLGHGQITGRVPKGWNLADFGSMGPKKDPFATIRHSSPTGPLSGTGRDCVVHWCAGSEVPAHGCTHHAHVNTRVRAYPPPTGTGTHTRAPKHGHPKTTNLAENHEFGQKPRILAVFLPNWRFWL